MTRRVGNGHKETVVAIELGNKGQNGVVVFWKATESVYRPTLLQKLKDAGMESLPVPQRNNRLTTLRRALVQYVKETYSRSSACGEPGKVARGRRDEHGNEVIIRPLASRVGYTLVRELRGEDRNTYESVFWVKVKKDGEGFTFCKDSEGTSVQHKILDLYEHYRNLLSSSNLSLFLSNAIDRVGGIKLIDGVYDMLPKDFERWNVLCEAVEGSLDVRFKVSPPLLFALKHEINQYNIGPLARKIEEEFRERATRLQREVFSGEMRADAVDRRVAQARVLLDQVKGFGEMIGSTFESIKETLKSVTVANRGLTVMEAAVKQRELVGADK